MGKHDKEILELGTWLRNTMRNEHNGEFIWKHYRYFTEFNPSPNDESAIFDTCAWIIYRLVEEVAPSRSKDIYKIVTGWQEEK